MTLRYTCLQKPGHRVSESRKMDPGTDPRFVFSIRPEERRFVDLNHSYLQAFVVN
jgi:hypothetical protein